MNDQPPTPPLAGLVTLTVEAEVIPGPTPDDDTEPDIAEEAQQ